jgi:hypothetical protein
VCGTCGRSAPPRPRTHVNRCGALSQGRQASRGRNGPLGLGATQSVACDRAAIGALFCVLLGPTRGGPCSPAGFASAAQHGTNGRVRPRFAPHQLATPTRSKCPPKEFRYWSSNGNSDTPTSGSPPPTCAESMTPKSSTPCTSDQHRGCPPRPDSDPALTGRSVPVRPPQRARARQRMASSAPARTANESCEREGRPSLSS